MVVTCWQLAPCIFPESDFCVKIIQNISLEKVWKIASFYYGLESGRSGKLSLESDGLESCSREKDVAPHEENYLFFDTHKK